MGTKKWIACLRRHWKGIGIVMILCVLPVLGAYEDGWFYRNNLEPHHILIRALNRVAYQPELEKNNGVVVRGARGPALDAVNKVISIGDNIDEAFNILRASHFYAQAIPFERLSEADKKEGRAYYHAARLLHRFPSYILGRQIHIGIVVKNEKIIELSASINGYFMFESGLKSTYKEKDRLWDP